MPLMLQAQPEIFGYFESEADVMQISGNSYNFGYNKFRLDVEARPNENILIGANINTQQYWGQTTWNLLDFLPEDIWKPVLHNVNTPSEYWIDNIPLSLQDTILLDNIFLKISFPIFDITMGRQQISPGVGYAWNPTDIFNSKTLLDPSYEQTGVKAIRTDLAISSQLTMSTIMQPEGSWENSTKQIFLKTGMGSFDIEITAAQLQWGRSYFSTMGLRKMETTRSLVGGSLIGELMAWGVWVEGANNILDGGDDFIEVVFGLDHTFDNSLYMLMEFLHNQNGIAEHNELTFDTFISGLGGETHSLMQNYGFLYLSHQTFDFVSFSIIAIANFNDGSGSIGPQIDWNIYENTNISLQSNFSWGADDTEFGLQNLGLRLRLLSNF